MCFLDLLSFRVIKQFFPDFFSHLRDRVLKQLVKNLVFTRGGGAKKKVIDTIPKILKIKVQVNPPPPPPTNTPIVRPRPLIIIT